MLPIVAKKAALTAALTAKKKLKNISLNGTMKKVVVIVIVIIAIKIFFGKKISSLWKYWTNPSTTDSANKEVNTNNLSYLQTQYKSYADRLQVAMQPFGFGDGTNEQMVFSVFENLQNIDDVLALISAFGIRKYHNITGLFPSKNNLVKWIIAELNNKEIDKLNEILSSKNINFTF